MMSTIAFHSATFARSGEPVLHDLTFTIAEGEKWAVHGGSGSGKTSLLEALAGKLRLVSGHVNKPENFKTAFVPFRDLDSHGSYYQQRHDFADMEEPWTLADYLGAAPPLFGLEANLMQPFVTLSNGQMRKARLSKALAQSPNLLLLDDPFMGLDADSRGELRDILQSLALPVVVAGQREADLPGFNGLKLHAGRMITAEAAKLPRESKLESCMTFGEEVIACRNVIVRHAGKIILEGIDWTVRRGERWAISGPNGAGKTTLLALIVGDHPQAFSNDVRLFGRRRGCGETIWDVKREIGFVSPEFHLYFRENLTALEAAETGYHDALLHRPVSEGQSQAARRLFDAFGASAIADIKMRRLSTSQQRIALLVRAFVKRPPLLVLDEPYQSLDDRQIESFNRWLEQNLRDDQTLIITSHRPEELPRMMTHRLALAGGRRVSSAEH